MADSDVECVVVGGGIVGSSCAYYLQAAGVQCALVDAKALFSQASTTNAGGLHFQFSFTAMRSGDRGFRRHLAIQGLNEDARTRWPALEAELGGDIELSTHGGVVVGESVGDLEQLKSKATLESHAGFASVYLDGAELRERCPEISAGINGGSWNPWEGHVNPRFVSGALTSHLIASGCEVWPDTPVHRLSRARDGWHVAAGETSFRAQSIVIAAGAWTGKVVGLLGFNLAMELRPLTMSVTQKVQPLMTALVMHASCPLSVKQLRDGNVVVSGGRPATLAVRDAEWPGTPGPRVSNLLTNLADAARVVPATEGLSVLRSWQGILGYPSDGLPVIGPIPGFRDAYVAVGGHTGWTIGPSCGWAARNLVLGEANPAVPAQLSPTRLQTVTA